jgi:hypothetical protein
VGVGPADPERGDAGPARPYARRPRTRLGQQPDVARGPVHVRGALLCVQGPRQQPVLQGQHHLDQSGGSGGLLGVTDVRLHRAQPQRTALRPVLPVGRQQGLGLDRVAQRRPGAVCLDRVDIGGTHPGTGQGRPDHPLLGGTVRRGQAVGGAVLVHRAAGHQREHPVPVPAGVGQPLQHDHARALGDAHAVGIGGEGLAPAVRGQSQLSAEVGEHDRAGGHERGTGQGQRAFAGAQRLGGEVQRDQAGGAGRVDREGRTFQAEGVGHPAGQHAGRGSRHQATVERAFGLLGAVAGGGATGEHPGPAAAQRGGVDGGPLQCLPRRLQQQSLLGLHGQRLARTDPEEAGVELVGRVQESARLDVGGARVVGIEVEQVLGVPAAVARELADHVRPGGQQLPEAFGGVGAAGESAADADDGDRLAGGRRREEVGGAVGGGAGQPGPEELRGRERGGVVEHQRRR